MTNALKKSIARKCLLLLVVIFLITLLPPVYADLGTYKQNDCIMIRVLSNCSSVNLTEVTIQNNTFIINKLMTKLGGQTFNWSFCNTSNIGSYSYSWSPSCQDCTQVDCGNNFNVTPSGFSGLTTFYILILLLAFGIMIFGFWIKDGWVVILGTIGLYLVGLLVIIQGIDFVKDNLTTWGIGIVIIGVAAYISINSAMEMLG